MAKKKKRPDEGLAVAWGYTTKRKVSKVWNDTRMGDRLGILSPTQVKYHHNFWNAPGRWKGSNVWGNDWEETNNPIYYKYRAHWDILKPSSFNLERKVLATKQKEITVKNQYLIPATIVRDYRTGKRPKTIEAAIKKAIQALSKSGQAVCFYSVNALIELDGKETSRQYIHSMLKEQGFEKVFSRAKAPFWMPKATQT